MEQYTLYAYFENKTEDCLYIGIAKGDGTVRHAEHLKPSKYDAQGENSINQYLQDNAGDWTYIKLGEVFLSIDAKPAIHNLESFFVDKYKPSLNKYKK